VTGSWFFGLRQAVFLDIAKSKLRFGRTFPWLRSHGLLLFSALICGRVSWFILFHNLEKYLGKMEKSPFAISFHFAILVKNKQ